MTDHDREAHSKLIAIAASLARDEPLRPLFALDEAGKVSKTVAVAVDAASYRLKDVAIAIRNVADALAHARAQPQESELDRLDDLRMEPVLMQRLQSGKTVRVELDEDGEARAQPQGERVLLRRRECSDDRFYWHESPVGTPVEPEEYEYAWATIERIPAGKEEQHQDTLQWWATIARMEDKET
jgi:hypothetical protein